MQSLARVIEKTPWPWPSAPPPRRKPDMAYSVTQIDDPELRERMLVKLWTSNDLHLRGDPHAKYSWFYQGAPGGTATAFFLQNGTGDAGEPVGCCGLGSRQVWVDGAPVTAGLFADFAVDAAHRTLMPALTLQRALCTNARARFSLTYGFPNHAAVGIFKRVGFPLLGTANRYVRVLRSSSYLERAVGSRRIARVLGRAVDTALNARTLPHTLFKDRSLRLEWSPAPDQRFGALFDQARQRYRFIGDRSEPFLRWRFTDRPGLASEFAMLVDASGALRAYAVVLEKEPGVALVADFLGADDRALHELFARLMPALRRRGFKSAKAFFLGAPAVATVLKSHGFQERTCAKYIVVGAGANQPAPAGFDDHSHWYLTEGDRDN